MIDTHAHLTGMFCDLPTGRQAGKGVVEEAKMARLWAIVLAASNIEESVENIKLAKNYDGFLFAAAGIHPQQTDVENKDSIDKQIAHLDELIGKNKKNIVAVGECGLDYSPAPAGEKDRSRRGQEKLFRKQICLSMKYKLPLIIHARKAMDQVIEILSEYKNLKGVFHCYAGGKKRIKKVLGLGEDWYFGIDGNLTYDDGLVEVVKKIPRDRLILETDSPLLTPEPFRGKENKPAYVKYVYKKVSEIWGVEFKECEKLIDENARKMFGINPSS
ncbi:TatD family hydrolase [Patescibacteria group bacterium]|nr:TatD family hydrolase [Patescibacteria group bacterium]MCG2702260.1 TatD family hydrolase [Candidatus Parcubacteria bacterium]MBU4264726.1 TatD family hydrolase [Patescibacteria group bacterium]MBU4390064.1 TatD family hydrolase [Patescibacteria group bacterium]MBU4396949.1 TatD family hydrolase [Patescibacteria group bacterium]